VRSTFSGHLVAKGPEEGGGNFTGKREEWRAQQVLQPVYAGPLTVPAIKSWFFTSLWEGDFGVSGCSLPVRNVSSECYMPCM